MSKYEPLRRFLQTKATETVPMTFGEVEAILGFKLPPSHGYRAWWSNNSFNNVMTNEWLAAGYKTEQVDIVGRKLVFRRSRSGPSKSIKAEPRTADPKDRKPRRHPGFGLMKGLTTIASGTDLTAPTGADWGRSE
jgi:hypothetical protein